MKRVLILVGFLSLGLLLVGVATVKGTYPGEPHVTNFYMSNACDGSPMTEFPLGTRTVYVVFDYVDMNNNEVGLRINDSSPTPWNLWFEHAKIYSGSGRECLAASYPACRTSVHVTNILLGGFHHKQPIIWRGPHGVCLPLLFKDHATD